MLLIGYLLLTLVVAAVLFYLVVALLPSGLTVTPIRDNRPLELPPNRRLRISDLDRVRIPVSLRGYRFAETDELIDRLAAEIQLRDEEIAQLRQYGAPAGDPDQAELDEAGLDEAGLDEAELDAAEPDEADESPMSGETAAGPAAARTAAEAPDPAQARSGEPEWAVRELGDQAAAELAHGAPPRPAPVRGNPGADEAAGDQR